MLQQELIQKRFFHEKKSVCIQNYTTFIRKGFFPMATADYTRDYFWIYLSGSAPLLFLVAFIYPFVEVISILVTEKSQKLKEGMRMMGAPSLSFWL